MSSRTSEKKIIEVRGVVDDSNGDVDLFNFLRKMHLTGGANGVTVTYKDYVAGDPLAAPDPTTTHILASRKRKAWEGIHTGNNKWTGGQRPPALRSAESDDDHLQTPNCSNTGYEDDETNTAAETGDHDEHAEDHGDEWVGGDHGDEETHVQVSCQDGKNRSLLSPGSMLHCEDIDTDNLAADFDGSFTGLGVDINTANYSMSEAMLSINNIAVQQLVKEEAGSSNSGHSKVVTLKSEPPGYLFSNYGALDLSNDDANHPDSEDSPSPQNKDPPTFSGSVSRDNSQDAVKNLVEIMTVQQQGQKRASNIVKNIHTNVTSGDFRVPHQQSVILNYTNDGHYKMTVTSAASGSSHHDAGKTEASSASVSVVSSAPVNSSSSAITAAEEEASRFQYILAAPTSILTKPGDPSLTYINQGQSYEIKLKKLGDISGHYKKKWLRSTIRICFHERRLQYIESEQIAEWSRSHPNERILEIDLPLSYGIADVKQDSSNLSCVSFLWDPTRDTGIFIKVHCISTEFTPKKHGGERGVPFRLQLETFSSDCPTARLHAGACILQVFKLKGADRKHKQDRDKISKRPDTLKDKFSPQYDCTVLTDLSVDSIYIPNSRGVSPIQSESDRESLVNNVIIRSSGHQSSSGYNNSSGGGVVVVASKSSSYDTPSSSRDNSPLKTTFSQSGHGSVPSVGQQPPGDSKTWKIMLPQDAGADTTAGWLAFNRYGQYVRTFNNFDARDLLRLSKDDLQQMIGVVDGIRLFNDLHMKPVSPRLTLFLAKKDESIFHPVQLQEVTVPELVQNIAEIAEVSPSSLTSVLMEGPNNISIRLTEEYLRHQAYDSAFHFQLVHQESSCLVKLIPFKQS